MDPLLRATPAAIALAVVLAVALIAVTVAVETGPQPLPGEIDFINWVQSGTGWAEDAAEAVYQVTGTTGAAVILAALALYLFWNWRLRGLVPIAIGYIVIFALQPGVKNAIDRARPDESQVEVLATWSSESYPSGHAIGTTLVWSYVAWLAWKRFGRPGLAAVLLLPIPLTVLAALIQGVHWPTDLLGGMLLGGVAAWFMVATSPPEIRGDSDVSSPS